MTGTSSNGTAVVQAPLMISQVASTRAPVAEAPVADVAFDIAPTAPEVALNNPSVKAEATLEIPSVKAEASNTVAPKASVARPQNDDAPSASTTLSVVGGGSIGVTGVLRAKQSSAHASKGRNGAIRFVWISGRRG